MASDQYSAVPTTISACESIGLESLRSEPIRKAEANLTPDNLKKLKNTDDIIIDESDQNMQNEKSKESDEGALWNK